MIRLQSSKEAIKYSYRYAMALYYMGGGGNPPRNGLRQNQYYVGQILDKGQFHVFKPDRVCNVSEFVNYQLVSRRWHELSGDECSLLITLYNRKKLALDSLVIPDVVQVAASLDEAGYLCNADESGVIELTPLGEAEIQHLISNAGAANLINANRGIRLRHHTLQDHEIDLAKSSSLSINVDGMFIRMTTLPESGVVIRVDHDLSHRVHMNHTDENQSFTQIYIDRKHSGGISMDKNKTIWMTHLDMQRLKKLLDNPDLKQQKTYLQKLERELERAKVVQSPEIPPTVVTMNSTVRLVDLATKEDMLLTLVYPEHANISEGRISVLAPIGTAMLGSCQGDTIECETPDGIQSLRVEEILYQPEAAGEYNL